MWEHVHIDLNVVDYISMLNNCIQTLYNGMPFYIGPDIIAAHACSAWPIYIYI